MQYWDEGVPWMVIPTYTGSEHVTGLIITHFLLSLNNPPALHALIITKSLLPLRFHYM